MGSAGAHLRPDKPPQNAIEVRPSTSRRIILHRSRGSEARASAKINAARSAAPPSREPITSSEPQPVTWVRTSANTSNNRPPVPNSAPVTSKLRCPAILTRLSVSRNGAARMTAAPKGTLTENTDRQPTPSISRPPRTMPNVPPRPASAPQIPIAVFRPCPRANVTINSAREAGDSSAAPSPWTARAKTIIAGELDRPAARDAAVNSAAPAMNMARLPSRSAPRPPSRRKPPNIRV